ncbi:ABC transporter ATP-binding protein [Haladaptatus sp. AB618]|uniref:ABC transporter ATP-binding protein n=1 Tax=Haladaptatus sp. AB618 TaxID=2934173 RepID=UPI00209BF96A|nr:ABC transporter ATP-binding protein [Haladaptatus sp. AB618]MCO8255503.1 ABC transporter ATP-binding protein [Haladaptatus sp. AB618]
MSSLVSVEGVHVSYGEVAALRGISLSVTEGEIVGVIGPNGAGKTTLVETISGFHDYTGHVEYRGREVNGKAPSDLVASGLVHCTESRDLFDFLSVEDNLELGAYRHRDDVAERLDFVYDLFPTLAERADQTARTMSGGEQQMLAIGRALMGDPDVLILDEPTLGLAPVILQDISAGLDTIRETGVTVLLAEQNVTFTMNHADRVYLLENGAIEREGDPDALRGDEYIRTAYLGE